MIFLLIHGIGGHAGIHWQQWLKDQLEKQDHIVLMPEMPDGEHPDRAVWLQTVKETVRSIPNNDLVIVGHSLGVTTALDFIEQLMEPIHGLVSVSGFATDYSAELNSYFLKIKSVDFAKVRQNINKSAVLYGDNDPYVPQFALKEIADKLGAKVHVISNGGHLNVDAGFTEFPQLLDVISNEIAI